VFRQKPVTYLDDPIQKCLRYGGFSHRHTLLDIEIAVKLVDLGFLMSGSGTTQGFDRI
jgi:hypothetical protein